MDEAARTALEKIEASKGFAGSERLRRFLRFAVEAKLNGQEGQIKEYVIGREVYDRGEGYDTRLDPIVRVEARRLRAKLKQYYEGDGRADLLHFEFPTGTYVPVIHRPQPAPPAVQEVRPDRFELWALAAVVLLVLTLGAASHFWRTPNETIAVAPAGWGLREVGDTGHVDEKLAAAIASELANRRTARVVAWPSALRDRGGRKGVRQVAKELGAAKVLMVSVRAEQDATLVTIYLVDAVSNEKMWVTDFSRSGLTTSEAQRDLARSVADEFEAKKRMTPYWSYRISMA